MRRFFTEAHNIKENIAEIFEDSRHIQKVLRMSTGDEILIFDGTGFEYKAKLIEIEKNFCRAEITEKNISPAEPIVEIVLFQALPKSGKMELIIQKAVELGVAKVVPVVTERCVVKISDKKSAEEKVSRWNKISVEAAKQCGRGKIPIVEFPITFNDAIEKLSKTDLSIMPYEELGHNGKKGLKNLLQENKDACLIGILVGPEGGFSSKEAEFAVSKGINTIGLGKRILRTETVASAVIPVIMFDRGEF
ncbi:MAG: 16S rRNA (uracil(1498)-N(3))-methyltransferase [Clostridia bacterium]|nr:16S rRNA (uracil(1498)-N(3))-methyltransferase [Clostridia bacterium]